MATRTMNIVEMNDGSIKLVRAEVNLEHPAQCLVYTEDLDGEPKENVKRILGNWFCYPKWVRLTDEQIAWCEEWTGRGGPEWMTQPTN